MTITWTDKKCYWLALHLIPGLGNRACKTLIDKFITPESVLNAKLPELLKIEGLRREIAENIAYKRWVSDPIEVLEKTKKLGAGIITFDEAKYPMFLKQIHDPPMLLYIRGKDIPSNLTLIAIVGSRNPTHYGLKAAEKIAQGLSRRGIGVVSGLARGIDSAAHWGSIGGKGFTIGVLGTGIDRIYPGSNRQLFEKVVENGAVISEFPLGTPPEPKNFPIRNRVISGLSRGVVVVEANKKSGSLITASLALEQGRDVFAVPGSIDSFKSRGCHLLIKQGAALVENSDDVLNEIGLNLAYESKTDTFKKPVQPPLDALEKNIYSLIGNYPVHIDQIVRNSLLGPGEVSGILMKMELKGFIKQLPGKMFVK